MDISHSTFCCQGKTLYDKTKMPSDKSVLALSAPLFIRSQKVAYLVFMGLLIPPAPEPHSVHLTAYRPAPHPWPYK